VIEVLSIIIRHIFIFTTEVSAMMLWASIFNSFITFFLFLSVMLISYKYIPFPIIFKKVLVYMSITALSLSAMKSYIYFR